MFEIGQKIAIDVEVFGSVGQAPCRRAGHHPWSRASVAFVRSVEHGRRRADARYPTSTAATAASIWYEHDLPAVHPPGPQQQDAGPVRHNVTVDGAQPRKIARMMVGATTLFLIEGAVPGPKNQLVDDPRRHQEEERLGKKKA